MKWKKVVLSLGFLPKFHEIWRFWRFWAEFSAKFEKKILGVKNYPFSSIIHVSIVFGNGHLQSAGPKILGHIIYRWKDIEKFYPVKVVRAWTIYMESCKFQLKLPLFRDFADFVESSKYRSGSENWSNGTYYIPLESSWEGLSSESGQSLDNLYGKLQNPVEVAHFLQFRGFCWIWFIQIGVLKLIKWDIFYTVGKILKSSIQWKWSEPGQFIWQAAKSSWSCPFFAISRILLNPVNTDWGLRTDQMRHILYRWKDKKKFHPVKVVRAWTIIWQASKSSWSCPFFAILRFGKYRPGS